ncbi:lipid binding protein [Hesseltinella vesiculosa]|uniref:Sorting nexin-4 n=1 Tax=Hesseltinella vesiculosa TaxID=101127 RepID=A0A1X2GH90_9FUNG|nr:lipid binding protein [Hesseltinella vesiculosa]
MAQNHNEFDEVHWDDYSNEPPDQDPGTDTNEWQQDLASSPPASFQSHSDNDIHHEQYTPQPMIISVQDPQKIDSSFVSYLIKTKTSLEAFSSPEPKPVRRRFQDFVWLYDALSNELPACIIPRLPDKYRMKYLKGDRFEPDFIEKRRIGLQWFLDRIANHPLLQVSVHVRIFLESRDFAKDKLVPNQQTNQLVNHRLISSLSDALLRTFAKVRKPEDRFVQMKEALDKLQDNLDVVDRLFARIGKRQLDLGDDYQDFSTSIRGLSVFEAKEGTSQNEIDLKLRKFAETAEAYATTLAQMSKNENLNYHGHIRELLSYCQAAKDQLKERDQKQVDFEEMTLYLQQLTQDRERLLHPGQSIPGSSLHLGEYVADQVYKMKGQNLTQTRRDRLSCIQIKLKELEQEVTVANDVHNMFSDRMVHEYAIFDQIRVKEMKQNLLDYVDRRVDFYKQGMDTWASVLPILESLDDID